MVAQSNTLRLTVFTAPRLPQSLLWLCPLRIRGDSGLQRVTWSDTPRLVRELLCLFCFSDEYSALSGPLYTTCMYFLHAVGMCNIQLMQFSTQAKSVFHVPTCITINGSLHWTAHMYLHMVVWAQEQPELRHYSSIYYNPVSSLCERPTVTTNVMSTYMQARFCTQHPITVRSPSLPILCYYGYLICPTSVLSYLFDAATMQDNYATPSSACCLAAQQPSYS